MQTVLQPLTSARIEAFRASLLALLGWLLSAILKIGARGRSARLRRALARIERSVASILFLQAVARFGAPLRARRRAPIQVPPGFRRGRFPSFKFFIKGAGVRARSLAPLQRVLRLIDILARPERCIAWFLRRFARGLRGRGLVAVAPPASLLTGGAQTAAPPLADTS